MPTKPVSILFSSSRLSCSPKSIESIDTPREPPSPNAPSAPVAELPSLNSFFAPVASPEPPPPDADDEPDELPDELPDDEPDEAVLAAFAGAAPEPVLPLPVFALSSLFLLIPSGKEIEPLKLIVYLPSWQPSSP